MRYISFDGVIMDTKDVLYDEWINHPERYNMPWDNEIRYIQGSNWKKVIEESEVINDAINILKEMDISDTTIILGFIL